MKKINRRYFLRKGLTSGVGIVIGVRLISNPNTVSNKDINRIMISEKLPENESNRLGPFESREVPSWIHCPRFYTIDNRRDVVKDEAWVSKEGEISNLVKQIADNGGSAFRLGIHWGGEVYYQSKIAPHAPRLGELDYLHEAIEQGKKSGVKIVVYINPNALYMDHPLLDKCAIRDKQGKIWDIEAYGMRSTRYACINNPDYQKFLLDILKEIFIEYKPDGLYVDGLTPHVCFCEHCQTKYKRMFNTEIPVKFQELGPSLNVLWEMTSQPELVGDQGDPDSQLYTEFLYRNLIDVTRDITRTVKSCMPDAVTIYHSWPKPETIHFYDGTLGEIYINQPWVHTFWKTGELTNYGSVFPIMVLQNIYLQQKTAKEARHHIYQVLANGMFPNCWYFFGMKTCFDFLRDNEQYYDYTNTRPVKFMAFPRAIEKDNVQKLIEKNYEISGPRDRFLAPYVGFYSAMMMMKLPIVTIHRPNFQKKIVEFKVLCLVNEACITDQQAEIIRCFVANGGGLIATGETSLYDHNGQRREDFALKDVFGVNYVNTLAAEKRVVEFGGLHPITKGLEKYRIDYDEPLVVVNPEQRKVDGWVVDNNSKSGNVPAVITNTYGLGRVVYIPARLDSIQCEKLTPAIEQLFANSVDWIAQGNVPVQIKADAPIGVTLFEQPGRQMLHLVNHNADSRQYNDLIEPVNNIKIKMRIPSAQKISRLHLLMKKSDLQFVENWGWLECTLPELNEYEVVVTEFI